MSDVKTTEDVILNQNPTTDVQDQIQPSPQQAPVQDGKPATEVSEDGTTPPETLEVVKTPEELEAEAKTAQEEKERRDRENAEKGQRAKYAKLEATARYIPEIPKVIKGIESQDISERLSTYTDLAKDETKFQALKPALESAYPELFTGLDYTTFKTQVQQALQQASKQDKQAEYHAKTLENEETARNQQAFNDYLFQFSLEIPELGELARSNVSMAKAEFEDVLKDAGIVQARLERRNQQLIEQGQQPIAIDPRQLVIDSYYRLNPEKMSPQVQSQAKQTIINNVAKAVSSSSNTTTNAQPSTNVIASYPVEVQSKYQESLTFYLGLGLDPDQAKEKAFAIINKHYKK
jgi:hypothetical protein